MSKKRIYYIYLVLFLSASICFAVEESATTEPLLTLSCKGADIGDVLRGIAMQYGVNIVPDSNVTGSVTIHLQNAPFDTGLSMLLGTHGFEYEQQDGVYRVRVKDSSAKTCEISVQDGMLTMDAEDADVGQLLREISKQAGLNIVSEMGLTGSVTAHLSDVPVEEALYALMLANGFIMDEDNGIYRVRTSGLQQRRGMGSFAIFYRKGKLSIDVRNAPIADVLSEVASQCKINLTTVGNVQGNVTMRLDSVTLEQALDTLTDATGNAYTLTDDIYLVGDPTVRPGQSNPLLERKIIWLKHIEAQDLISSLPGNIPKTSVTMSQDRNALILLGTRKIISQVEDLVKEIDIENPDIRSRQQMAISVEVDDEGLLTVDAKDASIPTLLREISIRSGVDMTILGDATRMVAPQSRTTTRSRQTRQSSQESTASAPPRQRITSARSGSMLGETVNFRISKATLEETFDALFKGTGYTYKRIPPSPPLVKGGEDAEALVKGGEDEEALAKGGDDEEMEGGRAFYIIGTGELLPGGGNPLVVSKKIPLQYLNASTVTDILPVTIPDVNITVIEDQNAIVVMGTQIMIDELEDYIAQIDSPAPQIMIEALLIEVARGDSRDLGVSWSWSDDSAGNVIEIVPGLSAAFDSLAGVPENFFATLSALVSENKARVLAKPRVATTNGLKASIKVGWTEYFETTTEIYKGEDVPIGGYIRSGFNKLESGITLEITPWVGAAGEITVLIHPDIKDPKRISKEHSTITERSLDTTVRVKDGETIVIGGLIQRNESTQETKVPVLGSIPILGHLFKESHKTQNDTELIIIVKPTIIGGSADAAQ